MISFAFVDRRAGLSIAIVRPSEDADDGWLARGADGSWGPLDASRLTPLSPPKPGLMGAARVAWMPDDTRDGDCLAVFEAMASGPVLSDVFNLLSPMPTIGIQIKTIGR